MQHVSTLHHQELHTFEINASGVNPKRNVTTENSDVTMFLVIKVHNLVFFYKLVEDIRPLARPLVPIFWTSGDAYPRF